MPLLIAASAEPAKVTEVKGETAVLQAGHPSLAKWLLPTEIPSPADNRPTSEQAGRSITCA